LNLLRSYLILVITGLSVSLPLYATVEDQVNAAVKEIRGSDARSTRQSILKMAHFDYSSSPTLRSRVVGFLREIMRQSAPSKIQQDAACRALIEMNEASDEIFDYIKKSLTESAFGNKASLEGRIFPQLTDLESIAVVPEGLISFLADYAHGISSSNGFLSVAETISVLFNKPGTAHKEELKEQKILLTRLIRDTKSIVTASAAEVRTRSGGTQTRYQNINRRAREVLIAIQILEEPKTVRPPIVPLKDIEQRYAGAIGSTEEETVNTAVLELLKLRKISDDTQSKLLEFFRTPNRLNVEARTALENYARRIIAKEIRKRSSPTVDPDGTFIRSCIALILGSVPSEWDAEEWY